MRILHIVQDLEFGGVTNVVVNLVRAFHGLGVENIVVTPHIGNSLITLLSPYTLHIFVLGGSVNPFNSIEYVLAKREHIVEIVNREKPDAVIIQPGWLSLVSRLIPGGIPILSVVHGTYLNEIKYMWFYPIKGVERARYIIGILASQAIEVAQLKLASARQKSLIVAVSKNTKKELINMGIRFDKIVSLINGVDKDAFRPMNKDYAKTLVEQVFRIKLKDKVLLHVNPGARKGTHTLIKAVAMLRRIYGDNFILLIVGRLGPQTYREYIEGIVRGLKLEENVKMLGYVEDKLLPILYNAAEVVIVPSYSEGSPLVIPEALACATPVVATNVGGNPEYLTFVSLRELIVKLNKYDFSLDLAIIISKALNTKMVIPRFKIPDWYDVAKIYLDLLTRSHIYHYDKKLVECRRGDVVGSPHN
jgi:glycosyltransferase involved in cell wall biosynthesis